MPERILTIRETGITLDLGDSECHRKLTNVTGNTDVVCKYSQTETHFQEMVQIPRFPAWTNALPQTWNSVKILCAQDDMPSAGQVKYKWEETP
ncbi:MULTISPECIES: hypothetical protein [unclassified Microcoleus]|uniref:hypothetical protein n=1 Tax=unclassified Microcoleus TaxID=2642155 RepID=UPI002FD54CB7